MSLKSAVVVMMLQSDTGWNGVDWHVGHHFHGLGCQHQDSVDVKMRYLCRRRTSYSQLTVVDRWWEGNYDVTLSHKTSAL